MTFRLDVSRSARRDLVGIHRWVRAAAGAGIADGYIYRIDAFMRTLSDFPLRGTPRFEILDGLRSLTFERRFIVLYRVQGNDVRILRIVDAKRDWPALLPG